MESISILDGKACIDEDECVDCSVCLKAIKCPGDAIFLPKESFEHPRVIRMQFSDPAVKHPKQSTGGRGTEEAKTNDVTAKFKKGEFGLFLEFGRPCTGTRLGEIEKITVELLRLGVDVIEDNPIFDLMEVDGSGRFRKEYVNEKILSAILELRVVGEDDLISTLGKVIPLLDSVNTVVSVGLVSRFDEKGGLPIIEKLEAAGIKVRPNAKINVGLGHPLIP